MLNLEPGATSGPHGLLHSGHEFVFLIEGQLEYEVEGQRFIFEPGDSLLFASRLRHRWRNPGKTPARVVIVLSGFEQDERPSEYHITADKGVEASENT
jgi:quercetin dioxygenase-like cupin family protein